MFKFGTIGAFKQVRNNPRCKVQKETKVGEVVVLDEATLKATAPSNADQAQGELYVVGNIIDQPEVRSKKDFSLAEGDFALSFNLADLKELPVELSADVIADDYASVAKGDTLVASTDGSGKWVKGDGASFKAYLEVLEKSTFGGKGVYAIVRTN